MLILTRRIGESVSIGADIKVVVLGVKGRQCRIGIEAPGDVTVMREEIAGRNKHDDVKDTAERGEGNA